ncbi:hypothetical protein C8Q74DRAFT_716295 [Fomes fomentarius]|nr:hypothetical protein C8Q74DRAFT_716295 [Fomes fomentarius]
MVPPAATWEEVTHFALNSSILWGTFEDIKFFAYSKRFTSESGRVGIARPLHANSALLRNMLSRFDLLLLDHVSVGDRRDDVDFVSLRMRAYEYPEDSDLEDAEDLDDVEDDSLEHVDISLPGDNESPSATYTALAPTDEGQTQNTTHARETHGLGPAAPSSPEDDFVPVHGPLAGASPSLPPADDREEDVIRVVEKSSEGMTDDPHALKEPPASDRIAEVQRQQGEEGQRTSRRTILSSDTAFKTWRSLIFYAYTGRIAFTPLRSQGFVYHDDGIDAAQLPICSPKSMYRLAAKYGNQELKMQAGFDIQSKLSTQNVLDELFGKFTSRYPEIRDMELNFLLTHMQNPDITIRLPQWIDSFAHGELRHCADTFGMLIHKLACAATSQGPATSPAGPSACPRGCPMPTIRTQWRCSTCGYVVT